MVTDEQPILRIERRFDVPPATVFDMLTDPEHMRVWWGENTEFDIDFRIGGQWTITRSEDGEMYIATGEYLDIQRPSRVQYTFTMPQYSPNTDTITIEIEHQEGGSIVTFEHSGEDIANELREVSPGDKSATEAGWQQGFDLMADYWAKLT
jgi:uncharacterized protein YndB with AHSA1/START domain